MNETIINGKSMDIVADNIQKLKAIFPDVFTEGKVDFEKLEVVLGNYIEKDNERYNFTWHGKLQALRLAQTPSTGTLRPGKEESKDWDTTQNLYIEGDNLEVLKLLQKSYHNKVKMIYIDPPYNTGNDFVYPDNYSDNIQNYLEITEQIDNDGNKKGTNSETSGRYHTNWLNMIYPRLKLARNLLTEDGAIFISIDDNELDNLKKVCNEIFGEDNFIADIVWQKKYAPQNDCKWFTTNHDYILVFSKNKDIFRPTLLPRDEKTNQYYKFDDNDGRGIWRTDNILVKSYTENRVYPIINPNTKEEFYPPQGRCWRYSEETLNTMIAENRIYFGKDGTGAPQVKRYLDWSTEVVNTTNQNQVAVFYLSAYTNTLVMAKSIEKGLLEEGCKVTLYDLENMSLQEMHDAVVMSKVILLGSPTINKTMVKPMWDLFSVIDPMANMGKIGGVFGSYGWSGEGITMAETLVKAMAFKMPVPTLKKKFFPSEETLQDCVNYGKEFAKLIK